MEQIYVPSPMPTPKGPNLLEGLKKFGENLKSLFATEKETTPTSTTSPAMAYATTTINGQRILQSEVQKVNGLLSDYYGQYRVYAIDVKTLYRSIDDSLVNSIFSFVQVVDGTSYEEILKSAMRLAQKANNPIIRGFDALPALDNKFGLDLIEADSFGVQRGSLAIIWSGLLLSLFTKYSTSVIDSERKNIVKVGIALSLGAGVAFLQFCHKSPESVTNYLRMLYEGYNTARDKYNQRFERQIPDILKINSPRKDFARMTGNEKITVGQVMNMVYTFRVGDMFLSELEKEKCGYLSSETIEKAIEAIWPTPSQEETKKIYRLYTENKIYYI